jgi:ATP-dependent helicase HepA
MSETEPELGIGFVRDKDASAVTIEFPLSSETRRYNQKTAPLRRLEFRVGDSIQTASGQKLTIETIENRDGLLWYRAKNETVVETDLSPTLKLQRPLERFLAGHWDSMKAYDLRRTTLSFRTRHAQSPARGLLGPRVQLLPHQIYVTHEVSSRGLPRALLSDEVGLGKTIEASWIAHRLIVTERARRILIITPTSLVNQWFVELFKKFNLSFWVPESQAQGSLEDDADGDDEITAEDLATQERVILGMDTLSLLSLRGVFDESSWDLIIVDEAHRIGWKPGAPSEEYLILQLLAARSPGLLLLTATPEQLGLEGHFARLHLIDPARFHSWEDFQKEHETYQNIVPLADALLRDQELSSQELKSLHELLEGKVSPATLPTSEMQSIDQKSRRKLTSALIDFYGTGRIYFRNSRQVVEREHCFFPQRHLKPYTLPAQTQSDSNSQAVSKKLLQWLGEFGRSHRQEKALLICSSAAQVMLWEKGLREEFALKVAAFHESMPLLARDRSAAYFEDPDGASILLSSEIGGEGRNFQHAKHLILPDLPEDPDLLEQRIGRLDRIGQASDIEIHVPYFEGTLEERLLSWHQSVFRAFDAPPTGAGLIYEKYRAQLRSSSNSEFQALLKQARSDYEFAKTQIEKGRDRLIEIHSFDPDVASEKLREIEAAERVDELKPYLERVFDTLGIHSDDLDADSLFVEPGDSMYVSYFPALPPEGLQMTFSRKRALARNDLTLMSWDHPMVSETMETIASQELGNIAIASWKKAQLLLDCSLVLEPIAVDASWYPDEFFPAQILRVVLDGTGTDLTDEWSWEALKKEISPPTPEATKLARQIPGNRLRSILKTALARSEDQAMKLKGRAIEQMKARIHAETIRLKELQGKTSPSAEPYGSEIQWWMDRLEKLEGAYQGARLRLDSFLLVLPSTAS